MRYRTVSQVVPAQATSDGAGVRLKRSLGTPALSQFDPFLMLDEFRSEEASDYLAGFPDHPHRGFETVTYMLAGSMHHSDHLGNTGNLVAGSVQWMTAGKGIVHSEMPEQEKGLMWGFQLWVNLSAADKMSEPRYQEVKGSDIPAVERADGVRIKVIAGEVDGAKGAIDGIAVDPTYFDVSLPAGGAFEHEIPAGHSAFLYVFEGEAEAGSGAGASIVSRGSLAALGRGDAIRVTAPNGPARLLLLAGRPLGEPIVKYGPFVMNTREQIMEAIDDFRTGRF